MSEDRVGYHWNCRSTYIQEGELVDDRDWEEDWVYLDIGATMYIEYEPPEKPDPWDHDDPPLGPQAA